MACAILSTTSSLAGCGDGLFEPAAGAPDAGAPSDGDQFVIGGQGGRDAAPEADAAPTSVVAAIEFNATPVVLGPAIVNFVDGAYKEKTHVMVDWLDVNDVKVRGPYGRVLRITFDAIPEPKPSVSIDVGALNEVGSGKSDLRAIANALVIARLQDETPRQWIKLSKQRPENDGLSSRIVAQDYPLASTSAGKWVVSFAILLNCDAPEDACAKADPMSCEAWCSSERPGYNCSMSRLCQ